jgi:imidazolonepropionase-like amidohydrolase
MWITNCNIVDTTNGEILHNKSIEIENGLIRNISTETPKINASVIDAGGKYIGPGIISCHTHLSVVFPFSDTDENENPAITAFRAANRAQQALASGITTIRCVHEQNKVDLFLKAAIRRGWAKAPRIFGAGRALSTPNGHGAGSIRQR